jgi:DNA end-binding protein Ku
MARPVWTGSISFGLVNVPVKAVTAVRDHDVHFHQLDKKSGSRIRNRKVAESSGKQVDADDIEMGFEIGKGTYVTFDSDELADLRPASTRAIEVTDFVPLAEVDPIYFERTYWLVPDGDPAKAAYQLLLAAMEDRERVAIGTVVMRNKQYLSAIRPLDTALAMSTMRFADEVVPRSKVEGLPRRAKPEAKALKMATSLIDALAGDWQPDQYHDTFTEELRRRIKAKDAGKEIVEEEKEEPTDAKVLDLLSALEASVDAARSGRRTGRTAKARTAKRRSAKAGSARSGSAKSSARARKSA